MIQLETKTIDLIRVEMESIPKEYHKPFNSNHEGYAILKEEVDELWDEIKNGEKRIKSQLYAESQASNGFMDAVKKHHKEKIREEAIQVAAMAIRIIQELT